MLLVDGNAGDAVTIPPQLNNAWARIQQAGHDFVALQGAVDVFVFNYLKRMPQGRNPTTGEYEMWKRWNGCLRNASGKATVGAVQPVSHSCDQRARGSLKNLSRVNETRWHPRVVRPQIFGDPMSGSVRGAQSWNR